IVLLSVFLISTLTSLYSYGSFWGWPLSAGESFLTLICLILFYLVMENTFKKEEVFYLMIDLFLSVSLVMLFGIFQLMGKFMFPFSFSKVANFNTIGSVGSLAIFAAVFLPLLTLLIIKIKKKLLLKILLIADIVLSAFILILANFSIAWWLVTIGAVLVIALMAQRRDIFDNRWLILPMFFLAVALLFLFFKIQIPKISANRPNEIFLSQRASLNIVKKSLKEDPIFGSGPGTFAFDFAKYKDKGFNSGQLWSVKFSKAGSEFLNSLATTGILGVSSFLFLIGVAIFYGIRILFVGKGRKRKHDFLVDNENVQEFFWVLSAGVFINFLVLVSGYFFYGSNLSFNFLDFLFLASFSVLVFPKKEFVLKPSSWPTLAFTFVFTLFFVFGLGISILEAQRCVASSDYQRGIIAWRGNNTEQAIRELKKAAEINPKVDLYWQRLAQLYIQQTKKVIQNKKLSKNDAVKQARAYVHNAISSAKMAVDINPKNVDNWSTRAFVYQQLVGVVNGANDWVIKSFNSALQLEPLNPYFFTQKGIVYIQKSLSLPKDKKNEKEGLLEKAKEQFEKVIKVKPDYASANFQLAIVYKLEGRQQEAIKKLEETEKIAPFDTGVVFQLGLIYYQNKDFQKAKKEFQKAIILNPKYSNAHYFLGLILDREGEWQEAIKQFEEIEKLNPSNKEIKKILRNLRMGYPALRGIVKSTHLPIKQTKSSTSELPSSSKSSVSKQSDLKQLNFNETTTEATTTGR
ncbi:MAG TPA: tetratricopeptide repeat protein, partial [Candidatus Portnoybacteria bacterium]|nr:tetratricopeptide repeat protein [Candidatus Portnoybacteria bacterium]